MGSSLRLRLWHCRLAASRSRLSRRATIQGSTAIFSASWRGARHPDCSGSPVARRRSGTNHVLDRRGGDGLVGTRLRVLHARSGSLHHARLAYQRRTHGRSGANSSSLLRSANRFWSPGRRLGSRISRGRRWPRSSSPSGSVALWWVYFDLSFDAAERTFESSSDPGRLGRFAYTYLHIPMVAGIIVTAVGDELVILHPFGHASPDIAATVLGGPRSSWRDTCCSSGRCSARGRSLAWRRSRR